MPENRKRVCSKCKTEIEVKSYFNQGDNINNSFVGHCRTCSNNVVDENEFPCAFCIHIFK